MEKNDIKKALYKQNTTAHLTSIQSGIAYYKTNIEEGFVRFEVPVSDMGDAAFFTEMPAKLLIRWIKNLQEY
jgi:hypothetical protein